MPAAQKPINEAKRLAALKALGIFDTAPERRFDRLTRIAAHLLKTPIALISLVGDDKQLFKSHYGLDICETPRSVSFCAYALDSYAPLTIPDATCDARFADNPLVIGEPYIRFYMGIPLRDPGGYILGTLCVVDTEPREVSATQLQILNDLAEVVEDELGRQELRTVSAQLQLSNQKLASLIDASPLAIITCHMDLRIDVWNPRAQQLFGPTADEAVGRALSDVSTALTEKLSVIAPRTLQGEMVRDVYLDVELVNGQQKHLNLSVAPLINDTGEPADLIIIIVDVTERERLLQQTEYEHQLLEAVMNNVDAGVAACDQSGRLNVFNRTASEYVGDIVNLSPEQWADHYQVYEPDGQHLLPLEQMPLHRALLGENVENVELLIRPAGKPERVLLANASAYGTRDGRQHGAVVVFYDITQRKELENNLKYQATHDLLTGLPNRGAMMEILAGAIARAERSGKVSAVMFLDLDGFKAINDTHGHQAGDQVLKSFAQRIRGAVRASDTVARLSGDEFVIIAEQLEDAQADAQRIADKVLSANAEPLPIADGIMLETSIGIALHRGHCSADELLSQADSAMYKAKQNGGSQVAIDASRLEPA